MDICTVDNADYLLFIFFCLHAVSAKQNEDAFWLFIHLSFSLLYYVSLRKPTCNTFISSLFVTVNSAFFIH